MRANCHIAHIANQCDAVSASLCDEFLRGFWCLRRSVDGDIGSCLGQRKGNAGPKAARRPGNQRCLALQVEFFKYQEN
jgi:hypothetical protein